MCKLSTISGAASDYTNEWYFLVTVKPDLQTLLCFEEWDYCFPLTQFQLHVIAFQWPSFWNCRIPLICVMCIVLLFYWTVKHTFHLTKGHIHSAVEGLLQGVTVFCYNFMVFHTLAVLLIMNMIIFFIIIVSEL